MPCSVRLNRSQIGQYLQQAGWNVEIIPLMTAIIFGESSGCLDAINPGKTTREYSIGLAQINTLAHPQYDQSLLASDPVYNLRAALQIYQRQGLRAWGAYTNGSYKRFLSSDPASLPNTSGSGADLTGGAYQNATFLDEIAKKYLGLQPVYDWLFEPSLRSAESRFNEFYKKDSVSNQTRFQIAAVIAILIIIFTFRS